MTHHDPDPDPEQHGWDGVTLDELGEVSRKALHPFSRT
jgi:hypothetical protein